MPVEQMTMIQTNGENGGLTDVVSDSTKLKMPYFSQDIDTTPIQVDEGEPVHIEAFVHCVNKDFNIQIEWQKDGKAVMTGSRFYTIYDRGYCALDIMYTFPEDTGVYNASIITPNGAITSSTVKIGVLPEAGVITNSQTIEEETLQKLQAIDQYSNPMNLSSRMTDRHETKAPPTILNVKDVSLEVKEGEPVHFECRIEPHDDGTLKTEWFKNNSPVSTGSRFNIIYDRGHCVFDIAYCYAEDSGDYVCLATNSLGQAQSGIFQIQCASSDRVVTNSNLSQASYHNIKRLDDYGDEFESLPERQVAPVLPTVVEDLEPASIQVAEGESVDFVAKIDAGNGNKISYQWLKNNGAEEVKIGSRITGTFELGWLNLHFINVYSEDSGSYQCRILTEHGEVLTKSVTLQCTADAKIQSKSLVKGGDAIQALESDLSKMCENNVGDEEDTLEVPVIVKPIEALPQLDEGQPVHLDVRVTPLHDNTLSVEWYKNDKQLTNGSRFLLQFDRGYASVDILNTIPEDSGEYWCIVSNKAGKCESNKVMVECLGGADVVTSSNLLEGSAGYKRIQEMDNTQNENGGEADYRYKEIVEQDSAPQFDVEPTSTIAGEGGPAKFLVKVSGFPRPQITWYLNDTEVVEDSNYHIYNDGSINCMEINRCIALGDIQVKVVASNGMGQRECVTVLNIIPMDDFRPELKHIKRENPYRKMMSLKHVQVTPELHGKLKGPKPTPEQIQTMESESVRKARHQKSADVKETEKLYDNVAANLRKREVNTSSNAGSTMKNNTQTVSSSSNKVVQESGSTTVQNGVTRTTTTTTTTTTTQNQHQTIALAPSAEEASFQYETDEKEASFSIQL